MTYKIRKLTPYTNKNIGIYANIIDQTLRDEDVSNIAITGIYGSGKSSLISTYKNKKDLKTIDISFAEISGEKTDKSNQYEIERKILQQIIYQVPKRVFEDSSFKPKTKKSFNLHAFAWLCSITCSFVVIIHGGFDVIRKEISNANYIGDSLAYYGYICILTILLLSILYIFYHNYINVKDGLNITKIGILGNNLEFDRKKHCSFFDENLDEIVYLLAYSDRNVFIFEDIDRFRNPMIFVRLRELLSCVNNYRKHYEIGKKLKFIYLIRDDLFDSEDRLKFFDVIIPVIPNSSLYNSSELINKNLTEIGVRFDREFLSFVSSHIGNTRLINNICNEFYIYKTNLQNINLDLEKLFTMIVYKNLYPSDYSLLLKGQGFINDFWNRVNNKLTELKETANDEDDYPTSFGELILDFNDNNISKLIDSIYKDKSLPDNINSILRSQHFDFIEFALNNGYIDEEFGDYVGYFYEGYLTVADKNFLLSLTDAPLPYNYQLYNINGVIDQLEKETFFGPYQTSLLNFSLINYSLNNNYTHIAKKILEIAIHNKRYDFLYASLSETDNIVKLFDILATDKRFVLYLYKENILDVEIQTFIFKLLRLVTHKDNKEKLIKINNQVREIYHTDGIFYLIDKLSTIPRKEIMNIKNEMKRILNL